VRAIQQVARENRDGDGEMLPLEESMRQQNVRGSDEPQLQYHQPDEMITRETILRNPTVATPEEIAFSDEMISLVELSLAGMKREDQEAFVLDAIEGFTPEEIAAISDRPAEEVRESIRRARERLQKTLTVPDEFKDKLLQHTKTA
jgi:DNA-directed RNA polymerase specialized sigma24 family protein